MADRRYRVEFCPAWSADRLERLLNERSEEGYHVAHFVQMLHQGSEEMWTTLVFEQELEFVAEKSFSESVAIDWAEDVGDSVLRREMTAAAKGPAVVVGDPLLDGGLEHSK
jgi:hypothetical protein